MTDRKDIDQKSDEFHLNWIHNRLTFQYGENDKCDYMLRRRKIIDRMGEMTAGKATDSKEWNGEGLPPVGVECEVLFLFNWIRCKIIGTDGPAVVFAVDGAGYDASTDASDFRPIRTHKQRVIESAMSGIDPSFKWLVENLYDSGRLSMPNDKEGE